MSCTCTSNPQGISTIKVFDTSSGQVDLLFTTGFSE
ncbi:DUF1652 domain-containing protein [Pseudomonas sp. PDM28]|nr:DUF1652 domain-containing protein [Pseudomonas sp. PDM28]